MREANIIRVLTQVVSLAMITLALTVGSAFAHGGPATSHDHAAMQVQTQAAEQQPSDSAAVATSLLATAIQNAVKASAGETPCSNDHRSGSDSEGCCTIACHAALAAPTIEPLGAHEPVSVRIVALADMLEGRSGDRTERPPRLS